jgi:hypothetical protein
MPQSLAHEKFGLVVGKELGRRFRYRGLEAAIGILESRKQRFDLAAQPIVAGAGAVKKGGALLGLKLERGAE